MKIKVLFFTIISLLALAGCSNPTTNNVEPPSTPPPTATYSGKIIALGDSLTEGYGLDKADSYPAQLQEFLSQKGYNYQVINSGISGETTTGLRQRLDWILNQNPDIIILTTGANDAIRGINLDLTRQNLTAIIQKIKEREVQLIFSGMEIYENLGPKYVADFKALYPTLAQEHQLDFIPFFLEGVAGDASLNIKDQIHPNTQGYKIIIEQNIWPVLKSSLGISY